MMKLRLVILIIFLLSAQSVQASEVLGVHILNTGELDAARMLVKTEKRKDTWDYVTIPFTLDDVRRGADWQKFLSSTRHEVSTHCSTRNTI